MTRGGDAPRAVLEARDLHREYQVKRGLFGKVATVKALAGVSFSLAPGETLGPTWPGPMLR